MRGLAADIGWHWIEINTPSQISERVHLQKTKVSSGRLFYKSLLRINELLYYCSFRRTQFIEILLKNALQITGYGKGQTCYFPFFLSCFCVVLFFFPRFLVCVFLWFALFSNIVSWVKASWSKIIIAIIIMMITKNTNSRNENNI